MGSTRDAGSAVLVPGIAAPSSLTTVRSLARRGLNPIVVTADPSLPVCRSKYVQETFRVPDPAEDYPGYVAGIETLARRRDVATAVPLREADSFAFTRHRTELARHIATPWPEEAVVSRVQDWLALEELAAAAGVAVPRTAPLDQWTAGDVWTVVKPRYSIRPVGDRLVSGDVRFVSPGETVDLDAIVTEMGHVPIAQEYVPGDGEYGYFALFDHGTPKATFQHRRVRSYTYSGGASVYRVSVDHPSLAKAGEALLRELDWHGPAMVEFKRDPRDGSFRLIEVNPRFWGSLALAYHAGVDFPWRYYRLAAGLPTGPAGSYEVGVGSHLLRGELSYLHSVWRYEFEHATRPPLWRAIAGVASSTLRQPNFDVLSRDDPRPFLADILSAFRALDTAPASTPAKAVPERRPAER